MAVLSAEELSFFNKNGYVVARQVISRQQAERTARAVWDFAGMDPDDAKTWYGERRGIMVEIYQQQFQWDNRTAPRVYQAFSQVWDRRKLWVSHDRASISPPNRQSQAPEHGLHWDMGDAGLAQRPVPFGVQGILYLSDTPAEQGAFICVPGFHRRIDRWLDALPEGVNPRQQDLLALGAERIPAAAGDLIIWHTALPHTASVNRGTAPRVAQYITMGPASEQPKAIQQRTAFWRQRLSGLGRYAKEREHYEAPTARLSALGRKLAGVEAW
jgi:ectoine hydroxylase-related dioxygenase (phytanoyl-CoA dioxygenase family)